MTCNFLFFLSPSMASITKLLVSHINLKGKDQSGDTLMGVETNFFFKNSKACMHSTENLNGVSLIKILQRGLVMREKSWINWW